jgi:hypothetical protein
MVKPGSTLPIEYTQFELGHVEPGFLIILISAIGAGMPFIEKLKFLACQDTGNVCSFDFRVEALI